MVDFGKPLYGGHSASHVFGHPTNAMDAENYGMESFGTPDLGVDRIGMSVPLGIAAQNVQGIYSKIRMGAGSLEIQFPGHGQGRPNAQAPEQYGTDQRTAIREMTEINEVNLTTHASFAMSGMTGFDGRSYDIKNAQKNLEELKTAIDFQADVGGGGSVVMHAGEFERPITDMYLDDETGHLNLSRDQSGRLMFRQFNRQESAAQFMVIDDRTHSINAVQRDRLMSYPVWNRAKKSDWGFDQDGNRVFIKEKDYIDYEGKKIIDPWDSLKGRVPEFKEDGIAIIENRSFDYFRQEAEEYNKYWEEKKGRKLNYWEKLYPEEAFARAPLETQEAQARGSSRYAVSYMGTVGKEVEKLEKLRKAREFYAKLDENLSDEDKQKLMREYSPEWRTSHIHQMIGSDKKPSLYFIDAEIEKVHNHIFYLRSSIMAAENQANEMSETKRHIIAPIKRLEKEGVRLYAEAAIHALQRTKDPNDPVVVAIEHIFPEQFGGHPEELKWIIQKSRDRMVDLLTKKSVEFGTSLGPVEWDRKRYHAEEEERWQPNPFYKGISREEAEKLAQKHIKATIDTGHINMWRKYWQPDPNKSPEENDRLFKDWAIKSIESLAKDKMIGNVHLADNFGYHDDHLSPGQGNSPVREIMNVIRKYGYDKAITVEPGADATTDNSDFHGLMKTWRFFGSPVYGMGGLSRGQQVWTDIQGAYFGQGRPPNYIFGAYAPSNDWQLWSQVPLE